MPIHAFEIEGSGGLPIRGDVHVPEGDGPFPVVVGCHGFKGFRNWGFWPHIATGLATAGLACVRYDMSHNGVGANGLTFDENELFERNTWAHEEEDLDRVLASVRSGALPGASSIDAARLGLIGHSRGGALVIVRGAADPDVRAVVALAPIATILRFSDDVLAAGRADGFIPIRNMRTGEVLRFGAEAIAETAARTDLHDIAASHAARMTQPLLVAHGTADPAVHSTEGHRLAAAAPFGGFLPFEGADHVLGCRHPWQGPTPEFERFMALATREFTATL